MKQLKTIREFKKMCELVQTNTLCHDSKEVNVFHCVILSFRKSNQSCARNQRLLLTLHFALCRHINIYLWQQTLGRRRDCHFKPVLRYLELTDRYFCIHTCKNRFLSFLCFIQFCFDLQKAQKSGSDWYFPANTFF